MIAYTLHLTPFEFFFEYAGWCYHPDLESFIVGRTRCLMSPITH